MNWRRLLSTCNRQPGCHSDPNDRRRAVPPGWTLMDQTDLMTVWRNADGDVLCLAHTESPSDVTFGLQELADVTAVRSHCRDIAESLHSGLVEAAVVPGAEGLAVMLICKRLEMPAFVFTGILVEAPTSDAPSVWTVMTGERGTTGIREAVVTAQLMNEGRLTGEAYRSSWAQDPYDPTYAGVDKSTLRYLSDDEQFDSQFPEHPLTRVRRELRRLTGAKVDAAISPPADIG